MNNVYEVKFEALTQGEHKGNHKKTGPAQWSHNNEIHITANGTVRGALEKAEHFILSRLEAFTSEYGEPMVERTLKVRITSCQRILTLDA